jgi:hypothetical protein
VARVLVLVLVLGGRLALSLSLLLLPERFPRTIRCRGGLRSGDQVCGPGGGRVCAARRRV